MKQPFVTDPILTGITLSFRNPSTALIADAVLPRTSVGKEQFSYNSYPLEDAFTVPDTRVGRTSKVGQVEFGAKRETAQTEDYGLEDPIPNKDFDNAQGSGYDPEGRATEVLTDLLLLDREVRTANVVFNPGSYAPKNKATLTGPTQWSNEASDPIKQFEDVIDGLLLKPNKLVLGRSGWTILKRHPKVVAAVLGSANATGRVTKQGLADILELQEIIVGEGWVNVARKGQDVNLQRAWGKHAALLYVNPNADADRGITFGFTAQWKNRIAAKYEDKDIGLEGGIAIRVGERVKELVIAPTLGYFFQNAVA